MGRVGAGTRLRCHHLTDALARVVALTMLRIEQAVVMVSNLAAAW
jgi:hypothetical protein